MFAQNTAACVSLSNIYNVKDLTAYRPSRPREQLNLSFRGGADLAKRRFRVNRLFLFSTASLGARENRNDGSVRIASQEEILKTGQESEGCVS
jgi:hypothetical protein